MRLFEYRGRVPGHETQDWVQAESELVHPCRHDLKESEEAIILHAELPGSYTADQLKVSLEARRLMVSGERELSVLCGDARGTHSEVRSQQISECMTCRRMWTRPKATATLKGSTVEIVLPKASTAKEGSERTNAA